MAEAATILPLSAGKEKKRVGCWNSDQILERSAALQNELLQNSITMSRKKRIKERLRYLQLGLEGKITIGGQVCKKNEGMNRSFLIKKNKRKSELNRSRMPSLMDRSSSTKHNWNKKQCLRCRRNDHILRDCPLNEVISARKNNSDEKNSGHARNKSSIFCFNCGCTDHTLKICKNPKDESGFLPFATCFICNNNGHLALNCDKNSNGMYPNGGGCRLCGSIYHKKADCPQFLKYHRKLPPREKRQNYEPTSDPDEYWLDKVSKNNPVKKKNRNFQR
ncbi:zinc knuckle domain-containing protein [Cardiosporidium cionae]|uniref:Zinc knuckle domain-containing protein n=1 Tax=Cardiosporidium cionae TaxID=476202 RepID=A0ABQ7JGL1_9APIC|nr:zinc knuckle domain-containing protein [Cardiosporidium cionae]|eukprot:KAF8823121.1 zinc knuckle domain-containing protein [Cardiosporidium cionae]